MVRKTSPVGDSEKHFVPFDQSELLQELEKVVHIQSITLSDEDVMSSGLLCLDLILSGGIRPGMFTISGPEQSAKTTTAISILAASVGQEVGLRVLWDAENSSGSSMDYVENIFNASGVKVDMETLFGTREKGRYTRPPLIYYRDEGEMDTYFDWVSALLRRLPDKRFEAGRWWYVYENTQENRAKYKGKYDVKMTAANNGIFIPAENGALQALIMPDSYPALMPASMDEDDVKVGMALQAREFAKHLPRVKGKLRRKRVAILGINQLREKIGFVMGDPRYEPGGNALKFNSDVRLWNTPRALSGVPFNPKGKGMYEKEASAHYEGEDTYRYIHVKAIKNKLGVPNRETWLRIWVQDAALQAQGFCPVWDTFYVMHLTGQVTGKRSSMLLNVHGLGAAKKNINWDEFKLLILGSKEEQAAVYKKLGYRPINLRKGLFALMRKGVMEKLYSEQHRKSTTEDSKAKKASKEAPDDDDDDLEDDD